MNRMKRLSLFVILAFLLAAPLPALPHAFPVHAIPGAGAVLQQPPATVTIYFDSELEPLFSTLIVKNEQGALVSEGKGQVDPHNPMMLWTRLTSDRHGTYHVYWSVVARDGHHTEGDYTYAVE